MFGFTSRWDPELYDFASPREPRPDAIVYGTSLPDALRRYVRKRPWLKISGMSFSEERGKTFAKVAALPNHGLLLSACPWSKNIPADMTYWS